MVSILTGSEIKPKLNPGDASILDSQSSAPSGKYQDRTVFPFDKVITSDGTRVRQLMSQPNVTEDQ